MLGGLGPTLKKSFIRDCICDRKIDFIGLQETNKNEFTKNELHDLCGDRNLAGIGYNLGGNQEVSLWVLIMIPLRFSLLRKGFTVLELYF